MQKLPPPWLYGRIWNLPRSSNLLPRLPKPLEPLVTSILPPFDHWRWKILEIFHELESFGRQTLRKEQATQETSEREWTGARARVTTTDSQCLWRIQNSKPWQSKEKIDLPRVYTFKNCSLLCSAHLAKACRISMLQIPEGLSKEQIAPRNVKKMRTYIGTYATGLQPTFFYLTKIAHMNMIRIAEPLVHQAAPDPMRTC